MMNRVSLFIVLSVLLFSGCATSPTVQLGPDARVDANGLHFVDNTVMDEAWFRPDADMTQYSKLMIVSAATRFADTNVAADLERQARFNAIVAEEFAEAMKGLDAFEIADEAGPDVLLMNAAIVDVELVQEVSGAFERVFVRELGSADLVIDLRDSLSGQAIVVAKDKGVLDGAPAGPRGEMTEATEAAVWSAVRSQARRWATLVRDRLEQLAGYRLGSGGNAG